MGRGGAVPKGCSYCGERRADVHRMVTLVDGCGVEICDSCLTLALRQFGGALGPGRSGDVCTDPHCRVCTAAEHRC